MTYQEYLELSISDRDLFLRDQGKRYRTQSLFYELRHPKYECLFTLKPYDYEGYRSLKQIYMELADPTEGKISTEVLTSLKLWQSLCKTPWFKPLVEEWREELERKLKAEAVAKLVQQSSTSPAAAQFLAKGRWKEERGRPSKEEKEGHLKEQSRQDDDINNLYLIATKGK